MLEYKKNPRSHPVAKFLAACAASLILLAILILTAKAAWSMYGKFADASAAAEASEVELAQMESQKANVTAAIDELSTPQGVEKNLRERFGVAKPGEGEIRIVRKNAGDDTLQLQEDSNVFTRIFHALFVW